MDAARQGFVMGAPLALWPNAHRQRQLAALLSYQPRTLADVARELDITADDAGHILRRLGRRGYEVLPLDFGEPDTHYRVLFPKGRVCAALGCGTILRRSNPSERCEVHGGGAVELPAAPVSVPRVDGAALRVAREGRGFTVHQLAAMTELGPEFVSQLERGRRPVTPAIAQRLVKTFGTTVVRR